MMKKQLLSLLVLLGCAASPVAAQQSGESDSQKKQRMEWFSDAKLGVFIHWGVYAVNGVAEAGRSLISICHTKSIWTRKTVLLLQSIIRKNGWI